MSEIHVGGRVCEFREAAIGWLIADAQETYRQLSQSGKRWYLSPETADRNDLYGYWPTREAAIEAARQFAAGQGEAKPPCPTCHGNGRVEMLEHCPDCRKGSNEQPAAAECDLPTGPGVWERPEDDEDGACLIVVEAVKNGFAFGGKAWGEIVDRGGVNQLPRGHWKRLILSTEAEQLLNGKTPWEFACGWYHETEIIDAVKRNMIGAMDDRPIPQDVHSEAFGKWLAHGSSDAEQLRRECDAGIAVIEALTIERDEAIKKAEDADRVCNKAYDKSREEIKRREAAEAQLAEVKVQRDVYRAIIEAATLESVDTVSADKMRRKFLDRNEQLTLRDQQLREVREAILRAIKDLQTPAINETVRRERVAADLEAALAQAGGG